MNHTLSIAMTLCVGGVASAQTYCNTMAPQPVPLPVPMSPSNAFSVQEYAFCHSSTNLQGNPAYVKTAAGLFWNPPGTFGTGVVRAFGAFSSAVIVNNTSNIQSTVVNIEYYDPAGTLVGVTGPHFILPEGSHFEDASALGAGGIGSARIVVVNPEENAPIVGATLHYFDSVWVPAHGVATDPDAIIPPIGPPQPGPGEGSYQQLQPTPDPSNRNWVFAGPVRITNSAPTDFENGSAPLFCVANPHDVPVTSLVVLFAIDQAAGFVPISTQAITLQPRASFFDTSMWVAANNLIAGININYDFEIFMAVIPASDTDPQLIGDMLVIDAYGDNPAVKNLDFGKRLRMTSSSMSNSPSGMLEAFELGSFTPTGGTAPMLVSATHVANVSFTPTGPLQIQYFNHAGIQVGVDNVASLGPGQSLHIGAGQADSPNFPAGQWNCWLRVVGNCPGDSLIGWSHREIGPTPPPPYWPAHYQYRKAYGEECVGTNQVEPGLGIAMQPDVIPPGEIDTGFTRKIMPIVRTWSFSLPSYWPGYTTFTNIGVLPDIEDYYYRFFELDGTDRTNYGFGTAIQPFNGLASGASSFAYEDSDPFPYTQLSLLSANQGNGSGRIDRPDVVTPPGLAFFDGINVLGDPFEEYRIGHFARRNLGPIVRPKPIDPVPTIHIDE